MEKNPQSFLHFFHLIFHLYPVQHAKASKTKLKMIKKVVKPNNPF